MPAEKDAAFLSFSLGPVQPFIAAARTVRDLWTGSYLLAWLTRHAMRPVQEKMADGTRFLVPAAETARAQLRAPCLPNRFIAEVPAAVAAELSRQCVAACRDAWTDLCQRVFEQLDNELRRCIPDRHTDWGRLWKEQIDSLWEIRTTVLPWSACSNADLQRLLGPGTGDMWADRLELFGALQAAAKLRRSLPAYKPTPDPNGRFPGKCSLLGSYEQMGPADHTASRDFWRRFAERVRIDGTRIRDGERLCAVSLVKRFAWPVVLAKEVGEPPRSLHFEDTATVAAATWYEDYPDLKKYAERVKSSHWLHWSRPDQEEDKGEERVPQSVWNRLGLARREKLPPLYYAILVLDGDQMGQRFRGARRHQEYNAISQALATFATQRVPPIVEDEHHGTLIYSGGDDVLALFPAVEALPAARELADAFADVLPEATVSAGLAVVHYKEDLRFALDAARRAEKKAKGGGRDALTLTVCRRSGEHATAVVPWDVAPRLAGLVNVFVKHQVSDRWAYKLRAELPTLQGLNREAMRAETTRLLRRAEESDRKHIEQPALDFFNAYYEAMRVEKRGPQPAEQILEGFVTLCQSASFLARGRDE